ncbi:hypothetical protein KIN20_004290 [Parelaphostrongylus tenuis]|uniref:Uncharacterized protein n=1 Tax=Parelaphostrongylus tenuis TaxID=148309 RepID=A0AAD5MJK0_PARTN|nr:hypothetical protein KIN20_004290 [Parelaphostrongylus tenuis]
MMFRGNAWKCSVQKWLLKSGVMSLIDEEALKSEQCKDCNQCTTNGYSVCMRILPNRVNRKKTVDEGTACSCAHSVPINCHNRLSDTRHPANITMKHYNICYLSALQAPPRPSAVSEKKSVVFTIEPFWLEPYWRDLKLDNLTFHYDYIVKNPEHCEGTVVTTDDHVHYCNNAIRLNTTDDGVEEVKDEDYEHSDNYDGYDYDLPEEVEIDRDIFVGASEVQVYYFVDVHQPRQLDTKAPLGTSIRDLKTSVESEILRYDLTSDLDPVDSLPPLPDYKAESDNASEEDGAREFYDDRQTSKSEENEKGGKDKKEKFGLIKVNAVTDAKEGSEKKDETSGGLTTPSTRATLSEERATSHSKEDKESEETEYEGSDITKSETVDVSKESTETTKIPRDDGVRTSLKDDHQNNLKKEQNLSFIEQITKTKEFWLDGYLVEQSLYAYCSYYAFLFSEGVAANLRVIVNL